jgi:hypothetical protein
MIPLYTRDMIEYDTTIYKRYDTTIYKRYDR